MKITVPNYKCVSWNTLYAGKHWSVRKEMAEFAHYLVKDAVKKSQATLLAKQVEISIVAHLRRRIDPDNICCKLLIDGLKGLVIKDDSSKQVRSVTSRCEKSETDYVEIFIDEV